MGFFNIVLVSARHEEPMQYSATTTARPLDGIRVLEVGQLLAGPFATCVLAYFGAEVIKIEPPGGDPLRTWRITRDGTSLWWYSLARNKKSVGIDLQMAEGRRLVGDIALTCDVLVENFRPGTMEKWELGPDTLKAKKPDLIYTRVSGYGQTGPYATKPGFASVCEAISGFRYVTGFPNQPPVRPNLSLGDTLAGMHAVVGILLALVTRLRSRAQGQVVDVAIYESIFNMLEAIVPEFDGAGVVREPSGSTVTGIVPTNTYLCADDKYVVIGANGDSLFKRLMDAIGRPDMAQDERLAENSGRVQHEREIDAAITAWTCAHDSQVVLETLAKATVPSGPIYNAADMLGDPHFQARGLFETVELHDRSLKIPAIVPKLERTPGRTEWPGPALGAHNCEVLMDLLGLTTSDIERLRTAKVVFP
jgi:crotonobetainyl-CoA:carnitine CoA-transferase CaiB-like acyl-CoA transferase